MIRANQVIDHYQDVVAWERSQVARSGDLYESGIGLPFLEGELYNPAHYMGRSEGLTMPRPSQQLLRVGFSALNPDRQIVTINQRDSIGGFIDRYGLALAGTPVATDPPLELQYGGLASGICNDAEAQFVSALKQVQGFAKGKTPKATPFHRPHDLITTYHDESGTPIILRKDRVVSTGLLLQDVRLDDVVNVPAGTIVSVGGTSVPFEDRAIKTYPDQNRLGATKIDADFAVRPLRLSPWAYTEAIDRAVFGITPGDNDDKPEFDRARAKKVAAYTLDDFRDAAATIMELCAK